MAIPLSDSIRIGQQKHVDDKYLNGLLPYSDITQVMTLIPFAQRARGLTVNINGIEYWWKPDETDLSNSPIIKLIANSIADSVISGGTIDISDVEDGNIIISPTRWLLTISSMQNAYQTLTNTTFSDITLSPTGQQRYIAFYGNLSNFIIKVEGIASSAAVMPTKPADTTLIGYVLVTDTYVEPPVVDLSNYAKLNGGNLFSGFQDNPSSSTRARVIVGRQKIELWDDRYQPNSEALLIQNQRLQNEVDFIPVPPDKSTYSRIAFSILRDSGSLRFNYPTIGVNAINSNHFTTLSQVTNNIAAAVSTKADLVAGIVPSSQLPSYLDDILDGVAVKNADDPITVFNDPDGDPYIPEGGKLYVDTTDSKLYRWTGTTYVNTASGNGGLVLGTTSSTAGRGDWNEIAYNHSLSTGNPHGTTFNDIVSKPTTVVGYGITDVVTTNSDQINIGGSKVWTGHQLFSSEYNTIGGTTVQNVAPLMIKGYGYNSGSIGSDRSAQLMIVDIENPNKMMALGYNFVGNGFGFINTAFVGQAFTPLALNPIVGGVIIGSNNLSSGYGFDVNNRTKFRDDVDIYNNSRLAFYEGADTTGNYIEVLPPLDMPANYTVNLQAKSGTFAYLDDISFTDILYDDLVVAITNSTLVKGKYYRITDYVTTHNLLNVTPTTVITGDVEPLIVKALTNNTLHELAYSEQFPKDLIYYEVSNTGIAGSTKGCIIKRTDTNFDVTFPNDFRNVKYRRWKLNPPAWNNDANSINALALLNNAIYVCTQTHATAQNPEAANSPYWTQIIQNNTNYLSYLSTGFSYGRSSGGGGTIVIPTNTSDFIDTVAIPNYNSNTGSLQNIYFNGSKALNNIVIYTNNQSFAFVRNTFTGGANVTFNLLGNFYCYDNNFGYISNIIVQGNNTSTASTNLAISFNNFKLLQNITIISQLVAYNSVNSIFNSFIGKVFYKVNGDRIENCNFPNFVGNVHFTSTLSSLRATGEKSIQDVTFLTTVGNEYNTDDSTSSGLYRPLTLPSAIRRKTFIGKYLDDTNTPTALAGTDRVIYIDGIPDGALTLDDVTTNGNTTTNVINAGALYSRLGADSIGYLQGQDFTLENTADNYSIGLYPGVGATLPIFKMSAGDDTVTVTMNNIVGQIVLEYPSEDGVLALLSDFDTGKTIGANTSGSSASTISWNGLEYENLAGTDIQNFLAIDNVDGKVRYFGATSVRTHLYGDFFTVSNLELGTTDEGLSIASSNPNGSPTIYLGLNGGNIYFGDYTGISLNEITDVGINGSLKLKDTLEIKTPNYNPVIIQEDDGVYGVPMIVSNNGFAIGVSNQVDDGGLFVSTTAAQLVASDTITLKTTSNIIELDPGSETSTSKDIHILNSAVGLVLRSPGNIDYRIKVSDAGVLTTELY